MVTNHLSATSELKLCSEHPREDDGTHRVDAVVDALAIFDASVQESPKRRWHSGNGIDIEQRYREPCL